MVSVEGIEPSPHGPKPRTLPLRHTEKNYLVPRQGIEPRPIARLQGGCLPIRLNVALTISSFYVGGDKWIRTTLLAL